MTQLPFWSRSVSLLPILGGGCLLLAAAATSTLRRASEPELRPQPYRRRTATTVAGVLAAALLLAYGISAIQNSLSLRPEAAVAAIGLLFGGIEISALALYAAIARTRARPATAALVFLATTSVLLLATYFYWVGWYITYPGDFLIWSESEYVNDTIKLASGYPLYSPQVNNESFIYVPGSQILTYTLAWLAGHAGSVSFYRGLQVFYTALAALLAVMCCERILRISGIAGRSRETWLWSAFRYSTLFLIATNSITNRFTHNLHGDALAQLTTVAAYLLLLIFIETGSRATMAAMVIVAPVGFLVKQSLVIWGAWYSGLLLLCSRNLKRALAFAFATALLTGLVVAGCYALWGDHFFYWTFRVLGAHAVSPLRSFQHLMDAWVYFAIGLLGGLLILRNNNSSALNGAWLIWLGLIATETYTSGIAWMLNHIGPGCLIAGVWFLAGLTMLWTHASRIWETSDRSSWLAAASAALLVVLTFSGMGLVRIPAPPFSGDAYRYAAEIERQFQGQDPRKVLLDAGSWLYVPDRVVMKDRAPTIGERGYSNTADFSGILSRISGKQYSRILVRDLHEPDFWYDHFLWSRSSRIRQALLDNYNETGRIKAVAPPLATRDRAEDPYLFGEISILEPKAQER